MLNCLQVGCVCVEFAAIRKCDEDLLDPGGQPATPRWRGIAGFDKCLRLVEGWRPVVRVKVRA
jgi:hypothetical protein